MKQQNTFVFHLFTSAFCASMNQQLPQKLIMPSTPTASVILFDDAPFPDLGAENQEEKDNNSYADVETLHKVMGRGQI